jgi:hypothetical protein
MSWNDFHHREETLRTVVDTVNVNRDGVLPMHVAGVTHNFADELDLVGALLLKWHARLSGNIERALVREPMDLEAAVAAAWRTTAEQLPGVRLVVDRCTLWPETAEMEQAMERAREREWVRLATAAGLASAQSPAAVAAGRRVEELAREGLSSELVLDAPEPVDHPENTSTTEADTTEIETAATSATESFVDRIKAVLAA